MADIFIGIGKVASVHFIEILASHRTDFSAAEKRARTEGRDDILNNIQERKQNEAAMRNAATKNGTQFKAKSNEFLNKIDKK